MEQTDYFSAIAGNQKVDAESGVISGVSVITVGQCGGKHSGTWVDKTTLTQLRDVASKFSDGIKVKLSQIHEHDGSCAAIIGSLKSFRIDGDCLRADLHLLKSDENFGKIIEMSAKMPEAFGLSVVVPKSFEKVDGKSTLRITDIFSIDLVEQPAANPSGLFSAKPMSEQIKLAADGKTHEKDCECKECMSKRSKKSLSQLIMAALGLSEDSSDETVVAKLSEALKPKAPAVAPEIAQLSAKLTEHETQLAAFRSQGEAAALSAKKSEIAGLVADATREGKVIPLTDEELTKLEVPVIKTMFSKLVPNQVKLSGKRGPTPPVAADGKTITFDTDEKRREFCLSKQAEGAAQLTAAFLADTSLGLTRN